MPSTAPVIGRIAPAAARSGKRSSGAGTVAAVPAGRVAPVWKSNHAAGPAGR